MRKITAVLIVLFFSTMSLFAQQKITGKVTDANGAPLAGISVKIKGTNIGTSTNADGSYSLEGNSNATLEFSGIGFENQSAKVYNGMASVSLSQDTKNLSEVVVTSLGVRKEKKRLGYSVSEVSGDLIEKSREQNVIEALAAKAPGTQIISSAGTPGASAKILIRGNSTFTGNNQPLMVVDGIPIDNSTSQPVAGDYPFNINLTGVNESNRGIDINPNDIASVTVLKGPAAAALYGSRGGNGAIIITTKKGKYGRRDKLGITFSTGVDFTKVNKLPEYQKKYVQGAGGVYTQATPNNWGPDRATAGIDIFDDKYDKFFKTGNTYTNNLAIDGGDEKSMFRMGVGSSINKGMIPNTEFNRTNVNFSGETKLKDWIAVGVSANYVNSNGIRSQNGSNVGGIMLTLLRTPINYDITDYIDPAGNQTQYFAVYDNPLFTAFRNPYTDKTNRVYGNAYTNISFTKDLTLTWKVGADFYNTDSKQIYDLSSVANDAGDGTGQINLTSQNNRQLYTDLILKYNKQISTKFDISAFAGFNLWDNQSVYGFQRGTAIQVPNLYNLGNTANLYASNSEGYEQTKAVYGEVSLGYNSLLYLTLTGRNDWTTAFGKDAGQSIFYPKADLSWIFSEHMSNKDVLSYGKLRLAYSDAGTGPDPYTYSKVTYFTKPFITDGYTDGNSFPYLGQAGFAPSNIKYPGGLVPAHVTGKEVGLELRFLKNRITFEATYYNQLSKDNLLTKPIAPSSGYQYEVANSGEVENKGLELALNADVVKTKDLLWSIGANWSKNKSEVLSLADGVSEISIESGFSDIGAYAIVGQPYGVFYGSMWERSADGKLLVGDDGKAIRSDVQGNIGNPNPEWLMGINTSLTYKGVSLSALLDIRKGGDIWNGTYARLTRLGITAETINREQTYIIDGVYEEGSTHAGEVNTTPVTALYYFQTFKGDLGNYAAESNIQDGSWVRLRSLNLGYRLNTPSVKWLEYVDFSLSGRNLWLKTKYKGVDPETSLTGAGSNIGGWDYFNNPGSKSYGVTVKFGF